MHARCAILLTMLLCVVSSMPAQTKDGAKRTYVPVERFDPTRDAAADITDAVAEAGRTGKRVLLDVGGNWCIWCRRLDTLFTANAGLRTFRDEHFVTVKINWSKENKNETLLSRYPKIPGYPHLFVLGPDGALLHSQDTGALENGNHHDPAKVLAFLRKWAP
jgi:thiol:disulfide interchange protein